jgi:hypothetical protein
LAVTARQSVPGNIFWIAQTQGLAFSTVNALPNPITFEPIVGPAWKP